MPLEWCQFLSYFPKQSRLLVTPEGKETTVEVTECHLYQNVPLPRAASWISDTYSM